MPLIVPSLATFLSVAADRTVSGLYVEVQGATTQ